MRKMRAKFNGTCRVCGERVFVGDEILWAKGHGVEHANADDCRELAELAAESRAEMRMEAFAEARLMGHGATALAEGWFDDLGRERGTGWAAAINDAEDRARERAWAADRAMVADMEKEGWL